MPTAPFPRHLYKINVWQPSHSNANVHVLGALALFRQSENKLHQFIKKVSNKTADFYLFSASTYLAQRT